MSILRLGAYQLPAAEVVLVQTLFRLFARGDAFRWRFVTEPPYDALLVDGAAEDVAGALSSPVAPDGAGKTSAVLRIIRSDTPETAGTLRRPIRADRLQNWLKATEHTLLDTVMLVEAGAEAPAGAPAPVTAADLAPAASAIRFKLRRWPPAAVLHGDAARIRMATLLSRRALGADELARMSGRPAAESQAFLRLLQTTGLVELNTAPAPAPSATTALAADASAASKPSFGRGLIASIRRRLGVGDSAT